jgi:hypothetical protein
VPPQGVGRVEESYVRVERRVDDRLRGIEVEATTEVVAA